MDTRTRKIKTALGMALLITDMILNISGIFYTDPFARLFGDLSGVFSLFFFISILITDHPYICAFISTVVTMVFRIIKQILYQNSLLPEDGILGRYLITKTDQIDAMICIGAFILIVLALRLKKELREKNVSFLKALLLFISFPLMLFSIITPVIAEVPIISVAAILLGFPVIIILRKKIKGLKETMGAAAYLFVMTQVILMSYALITFGIAVENGFLTH